MSKRLTKIVLSILLCLFVGFLCGFATQSTIDQWYFELNKPFFQPNRPIFITTWVILYILMGIAAGMVWARGFYHKWVKTALYHFGFQLLVNAMWHMVFFGFHKPFWAFLIIIVLLILIVLSYKWFKIVHHLAAYLLIPYFLWVCYLAIFNFSIWQLN